MKKLILILFLLPGLAFGQWNATQIASNTYNSVLRSMSQGVYDHYSDKSFFCFMQENSNPYVVTCDHSSGSHTWGTPQLVYTQPTASKYNFPTIDMLPDRRLVMVYGAPHDNGLGFAISDNPADASTWTTQLVPLGDRNHMEYPRIKVDRQGNIYLFFIHMEKGDAAHKRWYYYVKSEDAGTTWTEPVLCLQRELDDPYGMCEMYIGYTAEEPYRQNVPEKWWFAYTSSSGFQYVGTHTGADNSANLVDATANWGDGGNFDYRWLYNITKGTNSGIESANTTTVEPTESMDWDNGDEYGVAYHNIYHSDIFVVYYCPEDGNWYDAAHNNLGPVVSRAEMETETARPYISPRPPASKDVGYVQNLVVNNQGYPMTSHDDILYSWDGSQWNTSTPSWPANDLRYIWFADGMYYWATRSSVHNSADASTWSDVADISLPGANGYGAYSVATLEGHAEAYINTHEYDADNPGLAWAVSAGEEQTAEAIVLRTSDPKLSVGESTTIYAYITDKVHGARSRVRGATNEVTLSVVAGDATITTATQNASNGMVEYTVQANSTNAEVVILEASSAGLDSYNINLYVNGGVLSGIYDLNYSAGDDFKISPNPVNKYINLPDDIAQVKIINSNGTILINKKVENQQKKMPIDLPAGTYIIQLLTKDKKVHAEKIVVM